MQATKPSPGNGAPIHLRAGQWMETLLLRLFSSAMETMLALRRLANSPHSGRTVLAQLLWTQLQRKFKRSTTVQTGDGRTITKSTEIRRLSLQHANTAKLRQPLPMVTPYWSASKPVPRRRTPDLCQTLPVARYLKSELLNLLLQLTRKLQPMVPSSTPWLPSVF